MTVTNNIYQKQIKYHVFNAVTNSELTELVPVFTIRPAFPTSVKKVNTSFKNVWWTQGPTLLADLMIFCPLGPIGPTNFKNSGQSPLKLRVRTPFMARVYSIQHQVIKFVSDLRQVDGFFLGTPISSTIQTDHHDITEILLKVALNTVSSNLHSKLAFRVIYPI